MNNNDRDNAGLVEALRRLHRPEMRGHADGRPPEPFCHDCSWPSPCPTVQMLDDFACPECGDGRGWWVAPDPATGEPRQVQCRTCAERAEEKNPPAEAQKMIRNAWASLFMDRAPAEAAFDNWLERHDSAVKAGVLRELSKEVREGLERPHPAGYGYDDGWNVLSAMEHRAAREETR